MSKLRRLAGPLHRADLAYRQATAAWRPLPDFLIIGEGKCGTTSLYDGIVRHPSVVEAARKEVHFFDLRFARGLNWYRAHFPLDWRPNGGPHKTRGEASPYYMYHPHAPRRIKEILPRVKAIAMIRNPIDRVYSHHQHETRQGRETLSFDEAIRREPERLSGERERMLDDERYNSRMHRRHSYVARGIYVDQLANWLRYFDRSQLLVVKSEEYFREPGAVLDQVSRFLELPSCPPTFARRNAGSYAPIDADVRRSLADYYEPHNRRLGEFLNMDLGWN